jgi:glycolate dehydrogenase iron-sulfur subunit
LTNDNLLKQLDYSVLQQCMHCGLCLPTCPTYNETKRERHSPRGRIAMIRAAADGTVAIAEPFAEEMYYCLGCLACQSACPAGVDYAHLFESARAEVERRQVFRAPMRRFYRSLTIRILFMHPRLLQAVGLALWSFQRSGMQWLVRKLRLTRLLPQNLRALEPNTPVVRLPFTAGRVKLLEKPAGADSPEAPAAKTYRVGMLTGCVQDLIYADVNRATADVLLANGCEVVTPRNQPCCGSLHAHNGELELARELARRNLEMLDLDRLDAVISNAGGCGSHLKQYAHLLAEDTAYLERARQWDRKAKDIHQWLVEIGYRPPTGELPLGRVTYDQSCHLCHGQKVVSQPWQILNSIRGIELVELPESDWCCGSAGIYSITQPEQAAKLLERKLDQLESTGASTITSANPGCLLQLENGIRAHPRLAGVRVTHTMILLAEAYRAEGA